MARVPYLKHEELSPLGQVSYDRIGAARRGQVPRLFQAYLNSPEVAGRVGEVGAYIRNQSAIPADVREITILAIARELQCQYEFTHHLPFAREAGVRGVVIEGIKARTMTGMLPKESVYIDYAKQVLARKVTDATFTAVEHLLGRQGAVDLTLLVGYYTMLGISMMALDVELEDGVEPLMPVP